MTRSPTVRHRRLGRELRRLRERADLTPEAAASQLGWSRSKVNRVENARLLPSAADIGHACDLYGVDVAGKADLIQLGRDASQRGWWTAYSDVFASSYVGLEAEAVSIQTWEPLLIPGLLQSEDYARRIMCAARTALDDFELERRVAGRMARKISLLGVNAPALHAVIDECALIRPVGPPGVMVHQLNDILQVMERPNVTIQVLPLRTGEHSGMEGAFSVLSFGVEDPDVGYTGCPAGNIYIEAIDQVRQLRLAFERLVGACLSPKESAAFIAAARSNHDLP
ncbi:helix-turn-helix transcriptional regulator [Streptosporangium sp. NPDC051023]|uniref:helix-turn-helix domain-containing protein n=1 Tax=Streptosporangium sp. NPDC051023 TaxID=3155410 RepID=UPI00344C0D36